MTVLVEYETTPVDLEPDELAMLLPLVRGSNSDSANSRVLEAITPTGQPGRYNVRAGPYVGRLGLPTGRWIDFVSRFDLVDVVRLLVDAARLPARVDAAPVPAAPAPFFVDALAAAFVQTVDLLVRQGLAKGYRSEPMSRPPYGGRIDVQRHLARNGGSPHHLVTVRRRLTPDVPVNRVLGDALQILRRLPLAPQVSEGLAFVWPAFAHVDRGHVDLALVRRARAVAPRRYRTALLLADLIVQSQALAPFGVGQIRTPSMLFHMPPVWEAYVARWVRRENPTLRVEPGHHFRLAGDGVWATADVVATGTEPSHPIRWVYDAKYKFPDRVPDRADLYQMVAYCTALGVDNATLVYPVAAPPRTVRVGDKAVHVVGAPPSFVDQAVAQGWRVLQAAPEH